MSDAFVKALSTWKETGVPSNPEGWIVTAARNSILDCFRHVKVQSRSVETILNKIENSPSELPDQRLSLMFACTHPALAPEIRTPLMLQTVLGMSIEQISSAFLISPSALEKRLVRAKKKIKEAGIPFEVPEKRELPERLDDVLETIYAAYGTSWNEFHDLLEDEAIFLGRLVVELLPEAPEAKGLLSLMLFCSSRKNSRRVEGMFIPLDQQNPQDWNQSFISEAETILKAASEKRSIGAFQLEAAIQSAHVARLSGGVNSQSEILSLYRALITLYPSSAAWISYASAFLSFGLPAEAEKILKSLNHESLSNYQPYWVLKGEVHLALGEEERGKHALQTALGLSPDPAVAKFLRKRLSR